MNSDTALLPRRATPPTIKQRLEGADFKAAVAKVLPRHLTPERFVRIAIMAVTRTPKLASCDQASFFGALMTLSQYGLEPDGRRAHLIPFENRKRNCVECQLIIDWKGLAELAMRSGLVATLHADVVYAGDLFEYSAGKVKAHVPWWLRTDKQKPAGQGDIVGAYATAEFKDGFSKSDAMSIDAIDRIRSRSRAKDSGPWVTDPDEMRKKTVFRRLSKWLPLSPEFRDAVEVDDDAIDVEVSAVTPITDGEFLPPSGESPEQTGEPQPTETPTDIPAEATPIPEPVAKPEPPKPPAAPAPQKRGPSVYANTIRTSMRQAGISEPKLITVIHGFFHEASGCKTIDEVDAQFPDTMKKIVANWVEISTSAKEVK